jgi:phenylalanyl-tRNA synthetase beta subunit
MAEIDVENLRKQLREMKDDELRRLGRDTLEMMGIARDKAKQDLMEIQLEEMRAELRRRKLPKKECTEST